MKLGKQAETILFFICFIFLESISKVKPHNGGIDVARNRYGQVKGKKTS